MVFCIECGKKNDNNAKFCFYCGKPINLQVNFKENKKKRINNNSSTLTLKMKINYLKRDLAYINNCLNEIQNFPKKIKENVKKPTTKDIQIQIDQIEKKLNKNLKVIDPSVVNISLIKNPNEVNKLQIKTNIDKEKIKQITNSYLKMSLNYNNLKK